MGMAAQSTAASKSKDKVAPASSAGTPATKTTAAKTTAAKTTATKTTATKSSAKTASSKTAAAKKPATAYRRPSQLQPTPQRYREIQQSLADKGYFEGPVDGVWGPSSVEALKRFQRDQKLEEDGKISSLSLIALGLGPRRAAPPGSPGPGEQR